MRVLAEAHVQWQQIAGRAKWHGTPHPTLAQHLAAALRAHFASEEVRERLEAEVLDGGAPALKAVRVLVALGLTDQP